MKTLVRFAAAAQMVAFLIFSVIFNIGLNIYAARISEFVNLPFRLGCKLQLQYFVFLDTVLSTLP